MCQYSIIILLVFVDETGADRRNRLRKYGYSLCGKPSTDHALLYIGERVSAISCMSINEIFNVKMLMKPVQVIF